MTEDQLEQETLSWLADVGYTAIYGPDIAFDGNTPERSNYTQVVLVERLRNAINRLNPLVPLVAREDALQQVLNPDTPVLLAANRHFHRLLVNGVPVQYQKDGETRGDFVRLIDWGSPSSGPAGHLLPEGEGQNEWLAINQFSIKDDKRFIKRTCSGNCVQYSFKDKSNSLLENCPILPHIGS